MVNIFAPGGAVLNRLSYPLKFLLIGIIVFIPLFVLGYFQVARLSSEIDSLERERSGVVYIGALRQLIEHIPQHRGMTNGFLKGEASFRDKILAKRQVVDEKFDELLKVDARLSKALGFNGGATDLRQQWLTLKAGAFNMAADESFSQHTVLIEAVIEEITHVAQVSGLRLDHSLDSNYMVDLIVNRLPLLTEAMGKSRGLGSGIAAAGEYSAEAQLKMTKLMVAFDNNVDSLQGNFQIIFSQNPSLKGLLEAPRQLAELAVAKFDRMLEAEVIGAESIKVPAAEVFGIGTVAIGASFKLYDALLPALDTLLLERVEQNSQARLLALSAMLAVFMLVIYLFSAFYHAVKDAIEAMTSVTRRTAEGDLTARLELNVQDEMQHIAHAFNDMAESVSGLAGQVLDSAKAVSSAAEEMSVITMQTMEGVNSQQVDTAQV
ncbi:HAMP domain-containing protein, partial [Pseudomonadota bacterium]